MFNFNPNSKLLLYPSVTIHYRFFFVLANIAVSAVNKRLVIFLQPIFTPGRPTVPASLDMFISNPVSVFKLRCIFDNILEINAKISFCFKDYEHTFYGVNLVKLMDIMKNSEINGRDISHLTLIQSLYWDRTANVRADRDKAEKFKIDIERRVRDRVR